MGKLLMFAVSGLLAWGIFYYQRQKNQRRMEEIGRGLRCLSCDGTQVERSDETLRCLTCGYQTTMSEVDTRSVSQYAVDAMTKPKRGRWLP